MLGISYMTIQWFASILLLQLYNLPVSNTSVHILSFTTIMLGVENNRMDHQLVALHSTKHIMDS